MDIASYYYREIVGIYDFPTLREEAVTRHTLAYLRDSGFSEAEIFAVVNEIGGKKGYIEPEDLPESVWEGSLTKRGHYYCHHALQLLPPDPVIREDGTFMEYPYYQEMRARFTASDLVRYFYRKNQDCIAIDEKRDEAQFVHMLKKHSAIRGMEALDIVLFMIDEAAFQRIPVAEPFGINVATIQQEVIPRLQKMLAERHAKGYDKVMWRNYLIEGGEVTWQI